ncbi:TetR/AcrR family transcriptional regulator [Nocardioides coralli]|uniref:TetR/AcrR family transcriptional regulator n=1 Tax=Nocardioides coralli TaxID=2872154 RepID=UPI001CA43E4F|nr:TetR/AcrR family transcriptional regulator [Nocardioides coralli]QZY27770.1 TetR/AcrR family transcriptional regulator [Nocardioides coralli]
MPTAASRQDLRSAATRRTLLDATVACLVEDGYVGTTGPAIARRAGLSRGAQLHHFGTRDQMVVAAVEHLGQLRLAEVRASLEELQADDRGASETGVVALELLAAALSGPLYAATLELWVAARSHESLRSELVPAERRVRAELESVCRDFVTQDPRNIQATLDLLLGQGVSGLFEDDHTSRKSAREHWHSLLTKHDETPATSTGEAPNTPTPASPR